MTTRLIIYLMVLLFVCLSVIRGFKRRELSLRIMAVLIIFTFFSECAAALASWKWGNNMPVYHIYTPVNLALTALYFNYSIPGFQKYHAGYLVGLVGVLAALLNTVYFQDLWVFDSHAILFSGVLIVGMALVALFNIFINTDAPAMKHNLHGWIALLLLFYWCATFLIWALIQVLILKKSHTDILPVYIAIWIINIFFYIAIGCIFWKPPPAIARLTNNAPKKSPTKPTTDNQ